MVTADHASTLTAATAAVVGLPVELFSHYSHQLLQHNRKRGGKLIR
jgi:hypothetical protein